MSENNELISIIVPVYNVREYLENCIDSIIKQTYKNIEIIIVDDGSYDGSEIVCDNYSKIDNRIFVFHKSNGGLSDARNFGLEKCKGEYICFVDSDDWLDEKYIELLYSSIIDNNVLISQCSYVKIDNDNNTEYFSLFSNPIVPSKSIISKLVIGQWHNVVVWNKMYHKSILNYIRFPKGKINEDAYTTHKFLNKVEYVGNVNTPLYYYRVNNQSIMGKIFNEKRLDALEAYKERIDFFDDILLKKEAIKTYLKSNRRYYLLSRKNNLNKRLIKNINSDYFKVLFSKKCKNIIKAKNIIQYIALYYLPFLPSLKENLTRKKDTLKWFVKILVKSSFTNKKIFVFGIPTHGNLGDQAILAAEKKMLNDNFKDYKKIYIESKYINNNVNLLKKVVNKNDVILIHGGGFLGTLWINEEKMFRKAITNFLENRIIVLPQTIYFDDSFLGRLELSNSKSIYNSHKELYICCREKYSFDFVKKEFPKVKSFLLPDMVLYFNPIDFNNKRENILCCLRNDKEKISNNCNVIIDFIKNNYNYNFEYTDTVVNKDFYNNEGYVAVMEKIKEFSKYKLIITDRLHGFVFAFLSKTPCLVFENKSYKIKGVYEWIKNCNFIKLFDISTAKEDINLLLNVQNKSFDMKYILEKFNELISIIRKETKNEENNNKFNM